MEWGAGYYNGDQSSQYQTFTDQWQHYRQTYDVADIALRQGRNLKGIMFWHWAGVDANAPNGEGSTICAPPLLADPQPEPIPDPCSGIRRAWTAVRPWVSALLSASRTS